MKKFPNPTGRRALMRCAAAGATFALVAAATAAVAGFAAAPAEAASLDSLSPVTGVTIGKLFAVSSGLSQREADLGVQAAFDVANPNPGDTFTVQLPADMTAIVPTQGTITANGAVVGTVALDPADSSGRTVIATLTAASEKYIDLTGTLSFGAQVNDPNELDPSGGTFSPTITAGSKTFTPSMTSQANQWPTDASGNPDMNSIGGGYWITPKGDSGGTSPDAFVSNGIFKYSAATFSNEAMVLTATAGFTPGPTASNAAQQYGAFTADCAATRIYKFASPQAAAQPITGTLLTQGTDYTLNCNAQELSSFNLSGTDQVIAATVTAPTDGSYYAIVTTNSTAGRGQVVAGASPYGPGYRYQVAAAAFPAAAFSPTALQTLGHLQTVENVDPTDGQATGTLAAPGLTVTKKSNPASGGTVNPGDTITYTVTVTNTGNTDIPSTTITDNLSHVLDDAALVGGVTASTGNATVSGTTMTWTGDIAAGGVVSLTYTVKVDAGAPAGVTIGNSAMASGSNRGITVTTAPATTTSTIENVSVATQPTPIATVPTPGTVTTPADVYLPVVSG